MAVTVSVLSVHMAHVTEMLRLVGAGVPTWHHMQHLHAHPPAIVLASEQCAVPATCLAADGVYILEVNISCNLFNGQFDRDGYYSMLFQYLAVLAQAEEQHQTNKLQQQRCSRSR